MPKRRMMASPTTRSSTASSQISATCRLLGLSALLFTTLVVPASAWLPSTKKVSSSSCSSFFPSDSTIHQAKQFSMVSRKDQRVVHIMGAAARGAAQEGDESSSSSSPQQHHQPNSSSNNNHNMNQHPKKEGESPSTASSAEQQQHHQQDLQQNATHAALKKVRVAKAQAEIDRILSGPEAPVDMEAELEKVVSMSITPSEQPLLDAQMAQLESELYQAVKQQDFSLASAKKTQLGQLQRDQCGAVDDGGAILQVNAAFYRAFSHKSWEEMEAVWLRHDDPASSVCIHPSHKPLVGTRRISKSWKQMFASTDGSFQRNWMEPHQISIMMKGSHMAIVTCEEHVFGRRFVRGQKRQTELINKLLATNIFRKVGNKWYMCYHHSSWHPDSEAAKRALTGGAGSGNRIVSSSSDQGPNSSLAASLAAKRRRRRRQLEDDEDDEVEETIGMDGILGNGFGPILGEGSKDGGNSGEGKPKRIIMGASLSDLLNGGLGDLLGNTEDGPESNNGMGNKKNNNLGLPQEGAIIQFSRISNDDDDEEEELDEDDEDDEEIDVHHLEIMDDDDDDDEGDNEGESVSIIKEWAKKSSSKRKDGNSGAPENVSKTESASAAKQAGKGFFKDALRQNCISALRKLCEQGSISPKQKRVLLTDIITCSSKGDFSMVEVAFELLCGEGDDDEVDAAEEEFAEQCRVFAQERLNKDEIEI